jgi:hypothetical protein
VDRDGRRIESFFIDLEFTCDSGTRSLSLTHLGIAVRRDGSFSKQRYSGIRIEIPGGGPRPVKVRPWQARRAPRGGYIPGLGTVREATGRRPSATPAWFAGPRCALALTG